MKRYLFFGITSLFLLMNVGVASAHVLKQDNGIAGVLHIPPNDSPSVGRPTELSMEFNDEANNFNLANCDCQVTVKRDGQIVQSVPLRPASAGDALDATASATFPSAAVYDVVISGKAQNGSFHSFQLDYLIRVAGAVNTTSTDGSEVPIISVASLVIVGIIAYGMITGRGRYAPSAGDTLEQNKRKKHDQKT